jgi:hypothetical protein
MSPLRILATLVGMFAVAALVKTLTDKAREEEGLMDEASFTVKLPGLYTGVMAFGLASFFAAMVAGAFVFEGQQGIELFYSVFAAFTALCLFTTCYALKWRIDVWGDTVTVVSLFGRPKTFSVLDIYKVKRSLSLSETITAYDSSGKKLFSVGSSAAGYTPLSKRLSELYL